jgi:hypothetical protein
MTPVLHGHYDTWDACAPRRVDARERDACWELRLDRAPQYSTVESRTRRMLSRRSPRSWAYVWYGVKGRGVDAFRKRLKVDLRAAKPATAHFESIRPHWPRHLADPDEDFATMLCEAFRVGALDEIPAAIRAYTRGASGIQTLIYVQHQVVNWSAPRALALAFGRRRRAAASGVLDPFSLEAHRAYLDWWDERFVPLLPPRAHAILTLCFEVDRPAAFVKELEAQRLDDPDLDRTNYQLLDELPQLNETHVRDFLRNNQVSLSHAVRDREVPRILRRTRGEYLPTICALKDLMGRELGAAAALAS